MKSADLREGNNVSFVRWFDGPRVRRIFVQGQVSPGTVIIVHVGSKDSTQMAFTENNDVIQTISAY